MMTGEPLFPGESDIDQLYQICRVLGKVSPRHQILMIRNSMFKGMKQEQNTTLNQLFPDWNRDSLDFLTQCLKMDGMTRPDTTKLLKHELFTRDNFIEHFLVELRTKLAQEMQVNPLLKRIPSYGSGRRSSDEKKNGQQREVEKKSSGDGQKYTKGKMNLMSLGGSNQQQTSSSSKQNQPDSNNNNENLNLNLNANSSSHLNGGGSTKQTNNDDDDDDSSSQKITSAKHNLVGGLLGSSNQMKAKQIHTINVKLKENDKYARVASAKPHKAINLIESSTTAGGNNSQNQFDFLLQPQSPVHFQSLQHEASSNHHELEHLQSRRLSPVTLINQNSKTLTISNRVPQYFNTKRNSTILTLENLAAHKVTTNYLKQNQLSQFTVGRSNVITKRERERPHQLLDISLMPLNAMENAAASKEMLKEPSPRILPPPPWLTGNLKLTAQGKNIQIGNNTNGKRRITDWKSVGVNGNAIQRSTHDNDLVFPNCPGATASPQKSNPFNNNLTKKKLSPMSTLAQSNNASNTPVSIFSELDSFSFHFCCRVF